MEEKKIAYLIITPIGDVAYMTFRWDEYSGKWIEGSASAGGIFDSLSRAKQEMIGRGYTKIKVVKLPKILV
jgi:hypothetical protein